MTRQLRLPPPLVFPVATVRSASRPDERCCVARGGTPGGYRVGCGSAAARADPLARQRAAHGLENR